MGEREAAPRAGRGRGLDLENFERLEQLVRRLVERHLTLRREHEADPGPDIHGGGVTEVVMLSFWESMDAIKAFAGDEPETAKYYDFDDDFLLSKPSHVEHCVEQARG